MFKFMNNRKISRDEFHKRSRKRFDFLNLRKNKKHELLDAERIQSFKEKK
jgi:hypothetical protein